MDSRVLVKVMAIMTYATEKLKKCGALKKAHEEYKKFRLKWYIAGRAPSINSRIFLKCDNRSCSGEGVSI